MSICRMLQDTRATYKNTFSIKLKTKAKTKPNQIEQQQQQNKNKTSVFSISNEKPETPI